MPFRDVIGHRRLIGLLGRSVRQESLPPSLIFAGPSGVGKRLTAIATAQALNCTAPIITTDSSWGHGETVDACGKCAACSRIARGVHPDVLIVEPGDSGSIKIEQVRADHDIAAAMVERGYHEAEARAVAATADGSLGRALETGAGDLVEARDIAQKVLAQAASVDDPRRRIESAKDLLAKTGAGGAGDRQQLASHLRAMASLLRDIELLSTRADVRALANPDVQPALERLTKAYEGERGMRAFTAVDRALVALDRNAGVKIVADWLVLQL
jgi:DNA polymerase III delta subunit-like protein